MISNSTYAITSRFNKPTKELLVDYINAWNKKSFTPDQLNFDPPVDLGIGEGVTNVSIRFSESTGWSTDAFTMRYYRIDLDSILQGQPLTIHVSNFIDAEIYQAIREQYGILFETDKTTLVVTDPDQLIFLETGDNVDYTLTATADNLIFYGSIKIQVRQSIALLGNNIDSMMDLRTFYEDGNRNRPPLEVYSSNGEFLLFAELVKDVAVLDLLKQVVDLTEGEIINESTAYMTAVMDVLTGDGWQISSDPTPFNLMGARVIYNGLITATHPISDQRFSHVLVFELGDLCSNLSGIGRIGYVYAKPLPLANNLSNQASVYPIFQR